MVRTGTGLQRIPNHVRRIATPEPRAAGVSRHGPENAHARKIAMEKRARAFARRRIATFAMQERTRSRSGGREPAVASGTAPATTIPHTFGHGRRTRGAGAPGVNPPCVALTYLHRRFRSCSADCRRWVGGRRCNRVRVTAGGDAPSLVRVCECHRPIERLAMHERFRNATGGLRPPLLFARVRPPTELRLLRCTNEQSAPGAAGVSPPWLGESRGRHDYVHIRTQSSDG